MHFSAPSWRQRQSALVRLVYDRHGKAAAMRAIRLKWLDWRADLGPCCGMSQKDFLQEMLVAHPEIRHPSSIKNAIKRWLVEINDSRIDRECQEDPHASQA